MLSQRMLHQAMLQATDDPGILGTTIPEELHLSNNLQLTYNAADGIMHVKWQGEVTSQEFKKGYTQLLKIVRLYKPYKWILDLQHRENISKEDKLWVFKYIFPQMLRLLQRDIFIAIILPVYQYETIIHDFDGDNFIDNNNLLIMQHFLYLEESLRWLQENATSSAIA